MLIIWVFILFLNEIYDVLSHLHNVPITCKGNDKDCESNLNTIIL